jgi:hypothetical protein
MTRFLLTLLGAAVLDLPARTLEAQEAALPGSRDASAPPRRFFDRPIDYWRRGLLYPEEAAADGKEPREPDRTPPPRKAQSDWGQVVRLPDGTLGYQDLPAPLVAVLDDPTPEKIRAYFDWRIRRTQKVLRAAELMKAFREASAPAREEGAALPPEATAPPSPLGPREGERTPRAPKEPGQADLPLGAEPFTLQYFHKAGCPHCDRQDLILSEWLKGRPEGRLETIDFGTRPELWQAYRVRGTPSLVIEDVRSKKAVFLEGLSRPEALDRALRESRAASPSPGEKKDATK